MDPQEILIGKTNERLDSEIKDIVKPYFKRYICISLLIVFFLMMIALVVLIVFLINSKKNPEIISIVPICHSMNCYKIVGDLCKTVNFSVNPCDDFYQFACGSFDKNYFMPLDMSYWSLPQSQMKNGEMKLYKMLTGEDVNENLDITKKVKKYFESCLHRNNEMDIRNILKFISEIGTWPMMKTVSNISSSALDDVISNLIKYNILTFFDYDIVIDKQNNSLIRITNTEDIHHGKRFSYSNIKDVLRLLGANATSDEDITNIIQIEKFETLVKSNCPLKKNDTITTFADANEIFNNLFNLSNVMSIISNKTIDPSSKVMVSNKKCLMETANVFTKFDLRSVTNYMFWKFVKYWLQYMGVSFYENHFGGEKDCLKSAEKSFFIGLGALYVQKYSNINSIAQVQKIFDEIVYSFKQNIQDKSWIDELRKHKMIEKLNNLKIKIGFPDIYMNKSFIDSFYKALSISDNFIENHHNCIKFQSSWFVKEFCSHVENIIFLFPSTFNAYYDKELNEVVVLDEVMHPPLFYDNAPKSMLFGYIGSILAHEVSHAFDSQDVEESDLDWPKNLITEYENRAKCFANQYSSYMFFGSQWNGNNSLMEDIADNGGLFVAYNGYKHWLKQNSDFYLPGINFTHEQIFYIGYSQFFCSYYDEKSKDSLYNYPPRHLRLRGTIENNKEFAEVFNCPKNSAMNPEKKCKIW